MIQQVFNISDTDKKLITGVVDKVKKNFNSEGPTISFGQLYSVLNSAEIKLIRRLLEVDPKDYGFNGDCFGVSVLPEEIVALDHNGDEIPDGIDHDTAKYLSRDVFEALAKMNAAIKLETGKRLIVTSGYRSPAYQAYVFFYNLIKNNYDFNRTCRGVALPGYSEHGCIENQGIDFMTLDGISSSNRADDFPKTIEYQWLIKNAERFNFFLSYPEGNTVGVMFEPWHWHYEGAPS